MEVLVSDTSVLIDLECAGLEGLACKCGYLLVMPKFVYEEELVNGEGPDWLVFGLELIDVTEDEMSRAQAYQKEKPALSSADATAFAVSRVRGWTLLTCDRALMELAPVHDVECHGLLWFARKLAGAGHDPGKVAEGLERLLAHRNCRQPRRETEQLIRELHAMKRL